MNYQKKKEKKFDFKVKRDCALKSIKEINCFLSNINKVCTIKKIIK